MPTATLESPEQLTDPYDHPDLVALDNLLDQKYAGVFSSSVEVIRLDELPQDKETRKRHQRWVAPLLGSIAIDQAIQSPETPAHDAITLADAIRNVRAGVTGYLPLIEANVATAAGENLEKFKYVMDVELEETPGGEIIQFGQKLSEVNKNTIRFCDWEQRVMQERTVVESLSAFRTEDRNREGLTEDHWLVDISLIPDLSDDELEELGFFPRTKTGIIRGVTKQDGKLIMRSAFFAGVAEEGAQRHDVESVRALMVEEWDIEEAANWDINQMLETLVAIPKSDLPNGPVDVMPSLDKKIERIVGKEVSWGQAGPKGDYIEVIRQSKERDAKRTELKQSIIKKLLEMDDPFLDPLDATAALQKLVERQGALEVIEDDFYPTWVFGKEAQQHIINARKANAEAYAWAAAGDEAQARLAIQRSQVIAQRAQETAKGGGCPGTRKALSGDDQLDPIAEELELLGISREEPEKDKKDEDKFGSMKFKCPKGHTNTRPRNQLIDRCTTCRASVRC